MVKQFLRWLCRTNIEHLQFLYLNGDIDAEFRDERIFFWRTIKAKWVNDECHHICAFCNYKYECWSNAKE